MRFEVCVRLSQVRRVSCVCTRIIHVTTIYNDQAGVWRILNVKYWKPAFYQYYLELNSTQSACDWLHIPNSTIRQNVYGCGFALGSLSRECTSVGEHMGACSTCETRGPCPRFSRVRVSVYGGQTHRWCRPTCMMHRMHIWRWLYTNRSPKHTHI